MTSVILRGDLVISLRCLRPCVPSTGGERGGGSGSSDYGSVYGRGNRGVGRGRGRGGRGSRGGPRDRGYRSCGPRVVVEAGPAIVEAGPAAVEVGSHHLALPTLSSGRTSPLPAEHIEATGIKRQQYGNAGRTIRLRNGYAEVKLD